MKKGNKSYDSKQRMYKMTYIFNSVQEAESKRASLHAALREDFKKQFPVIWIEGSGNNIILSSKDKKCLEYGIKKFEEKYEEFYPGKSL